MHAWKLLCNHNRKMGNLFYESDNKTFEKVAIFKGDMSFLKG